MTKITQEFVMSTFDYRDGELFWKVNPPHHIKIGSKAGSLNGGGYYLICINSKRYYAHRLIYLYHHGYLPKFLDHIDNNPSNNKIENLREATLSQNQWNQTPHKNCSSAHKGVGWNKTANKWQSHITIDGKLKHLGYFESETDAAIAYNNAATKYFGEYANLNKIEDK